MMRRTLATLAVAAVGLIGAVGVTPASAVPAASISCVNASTPGGTKCLAAGEFCSHKPGYAAAYRRAGFKCKANGHLTYR
jgi:hypothetical protein